MNVDVYITHIPSDWTVLYQQEIDFEGYNPWFHWFDGNYGCDCNRHIFFEGALGRDVDWDDCPCGNELYAIELELI